MSGIDEYTTSVEDLFVQFLTNDSELFVRCKNITDPSYFDSELNKKAISFIEEHCNKHNALPTFEQIKAVTGKNIEKIENIRENHVDWFLEEYEIFCRHRALEAAILGSVDLLEQKRYGEVEVRVKAAVQIGLVKDLGTNYYEDPVKRLEEIRDNAGMISTGWKDIDSKLYGGMNRGELTIFAGQPGAGKSLFLQNLAVNWAEQGLNVVYITLELSENLTSMRMDSMISHYGTRDIMKNIDDVAMRVKVSQKRHKGTLQLKYMSSGSSTNDIRSFVKEYEIQRDLRVDGILVDYLDLCSPVSVKVSPSDQFIRDKYVSEELRNIAQDLDILMASASQLNRSSFEEIEFNPANIAGGISKINTADNVIAIFVTTAMKEIGKYQVQFMKTRSSSGVGSKVDLSFGPTLRITDLPEDAEGAVDSQTSNILGKLKQKRVVEDTPPPQKAATAVSAFDRVTAIRGILKSQE